LLAVGCGSKSAPPPTTSTTTSAATTTSSADEQREREANAERVKKEQIVATHRKAELEQQNAMAASCSEPKPWTKHERCLPSCYPTEAPAAAAETKLAGPTELEHIVCRRDGEVPFAIVDELDPTLRVAKVRGGFRSLTERAAPKRRSLRGLRTARSSRRVTWSSSTESGAATNIRSVASRSAA
jgi:hypothetical protein